MLILADGRLSTHRRRFPQAEAVIHEQVHAIKVSPTISSKGPERCRSEESP
jgi:hypothetical protein